MTKKILVIEDNLDVRENLEEILVLNHYEVETAENGLVGVEKARKNKPDLIVCDISMPLMDGFCVLQVLAADAELKTVPFIFLTARTDRETQRRGMEMGADDFITKPFHEEELIRAIETRFRKSMFAETHFVRSAEGFKAFMEDAKSLEVVRSTAENHNALTYEKKSIIYHEGDEPRHLYFIEQGKVKTVKMSDDGKELISGVFSEGEFFGYLAMFEDTEHAESAIALEHTVLATITKNQFFEIVSSNPAIAAKFIRILANQVTDTEDKLLHVAYDSVRKRTAEALVDMYRAYANGGSKGEITISRQELAQYIGTATETVIRTLASLKNDKLIDILNGDIHIRDLAGLLRLKS
jgi:CRP-like cAMP-binding protein/CheY-like chemotaxis protein